MEAKQQVDVLIKGGVVVNGQAMQRADIAIADGVITAMGEIENTHTMAQTIDAQGKYVLPGVIDPHCHPVYADKMETFSVSAAFGGVTTVIGFVGSSASWGGDGELLSSLQRFIEESEQTSLIDFAVHAALVQQDMQNLELLIPQAIAMGVPSFKIFMAYSRRGMKLEDPDVLRCMALLKEHSGQFMVHAENGAIIDYLIDTFVAQGKRTPEYFLPSQPNLVEAEAVFRTATMGAIMGIPVYFVHISTRESLDVIRWFRQRGEPRIYVETCPHYLTLTDACLTECGSLAKVGPPLRQPEDREALWQAVCDGTIDVIGSDAAGHRRRRKEPIWSDIFRAPYGLPGVETLLPVVYDEGVSHGRTNLCRLVQLTSENPARIFGLYPRKGILAPGSDADLVLFDPMKAHRITAETLHLNADYTLHEGRHCLGMPVLTMQRGQILVENGELKGRPGSGNYLPRQRKSPDDAAI
jgi:dihydropyrimidinase